MKRALPFVIPAILILLLSIVLGLANRYATDRGSPAALISSYADAAGEGNLSTLRELGVASKVDQEAEIMGRAYFDRTSHALFRSIVSGCQLADAAQERFKKELMPEAKLAFRTEKPQDVDRNTWILNRALAGLSSTEKQFVRLGAENTVETTWTEILEAGDRDWDRLSYRVRRKVERNGDKNLFFCEYGATKTYEETQSLLMLAGASAQTEDDQKFLTDAVLVAWRDGSAYREKHGPELLSALYRRSFENGSLSDLSVDEAPVVGRLFRPGKATVSASASGAEVEAGMTLGEDGWSILSVRDIEVISVAEELCSLQQDPPPEADEPEPKKEPRYEEPRKTATKEYEPPPEKPRVRPPAPLAGECSWMDVDQGALQYSRIGIGADNEPETMGAWSKVILAVLILTFVAVMLSAARGRNLDAAKINLRDGEEALEALNTPGRFVRGRLTLTTHRLVFQRVHWWLASTTTTMLPVPSLETASLRFGMNPIWILLGVLLMPIIAPAGVLIAMYALIAARVRMLFAIGGRNHSFGLSGTDEAVRDGFQLLRRTFRQQAILNDGAAGTSALLDPDPKPDLRFLPAIAWYAVLATMAAAAIQRVFYTGVDLEAGIWLVPYLVLPGLVGIVGGARAGGLMGIFGALGLFAVMQPSPYTSMGSVGASANAMVVLATVVASAATGILSGKLQKGILPVLAAVIAMALWWMLPNIADAPIAGTMVWGAQTMAAAAIFLGAVGALIMAGKIQVPLVPDDDDAPAPEEPADEAPADEEPAPEEPAPEDG